MLGVRVDGVTVGGKPVVPWGPDLFPEGGACIRVKGPRPVMPGEKHGRQPCQCVKRARLDEATSFKKKTLEFPSWLSGDKSD